MKVLAIALLATIAVVCASQEASRPAGQPRQLYTRDRLSFKRRLVNDLGGAHHSRSRPTKRSITFLSHVIGSGSSKRAPKIGTPGSEVQPAKEFTAPQIIPILQMGGGLFPGVEGITNDNQVA